MIHSPEYSDINKFLTSLGIIMILGGVFIFVYVHNTSFEIVKEFLTSYSPEILKQKGYNEETISQINFLYGNELKFNIVLIRIIPPFSILLVFVGIILFISGLNNWAKKQGKVDMKEEIELKLAELNLKTRMRDFEEEKLENVVYNLKGARKIK